MNTTATHYTAGRRTAVRPRVFLAAPFAQLIDGDAVTDTWRDRLEAVRRALLEDGFHVFSAHHNEAWGAAGLPPEECVPSDFRAMVACDAVCAYLGNPVSTGVAMELGWASLLRKPVVLAHNRGTVLSPMLRGLGTLTRVTEVTLENGLDKAAVQALASATGTLAHAAVEAAASPWHADGLSASLRYVAAPEEVPV
ncbi:nucleoside 2-deoxyribosyltransferase [Streptomyces albus]|uniref:nucleoside 2-deoxyribosyltransferase n=1 Tax=Streptomyces albus TaxID=1888 RepID=UPI003F1B43FD